MISIKFNRQNSIIAALIIVAVLLPLRSSAQTELTPEFIGTNGAPSSLASLGFSIPSGLVTPEWDTFLKICIAQGHPRLLRPILPKNNDPLYDPRNLILEAFKRDPDSFSATVKYLEEQNVRPTTVLENARLDPMILEHFYDALEMQVRDTYKWQAALLKKSTRLRQAAIDDPRSYQVLVELNLTIDQANRLFRGLSIFLDRNTIRELRAAQASAKESANRIIILRAVMPDATLTSESALTDRIRTKGLPLSIADSIKLFPLSSHNYSHSASKEKIGSVDTGFTIPANFSEIYSQLKSPEDDPLPSNSFTIDHTGDSDQTSWRSQGFPPANRIQYFTHALSPKEVEKIKARIAELVDHPSSNNLRRDTLPVFRVNFTADVPMPPARMTTHLIRPYGSTLFHAFLYQRLLYHALSGIVSDFHYYASQAKLSLLRWLYNSIEKNRFQALLWLTGGISAAMSLSVFGWLPVGFGLALAGTGLVLLMPIVKNRILKSLYWKTFWQMDTFEDAT